MIMTDAVAMAIITAVPPTVASIVAVVIGLHNKGGIQEVRAQTQEIKTNTDGLVSKLLTAKDEKSVLAVEGAHTEGVAEGVKSEQDKK